MSVAAAEGHTVVATASGAVYCWGRGGDGQLGDGRGETSASPVKALIPPEAMGAMTVSAGRAHTMCVASNGKLYSWGRTGGRLGLGLSSWSKAQKGLRSTMIKSPLKDRTLSGKPFPPVRTESAGRDSVLSLGAGGGGARPSNIRLSPAADEDSAGDGQSEAYMSPCEVAGPWGRDGGVLSAAIGDFHSVVLTARGRVFTFGTGCFAGQLGPAYHRITLPMIIIMSMGPGCAAFDFAHGDVGVCLWRTESSGLLHRRAWGPEGNRGAGGGQGAAGRRRGWRPGSGGADSAGFPEAEFCRVISESMT